MGCEEVASEKIVSKSALPFLRHGGWEGGPLPQEEEFSTSVHVNTGFLPNMFTYAQSGRTNTRKERVVGWGCPCLSKT